MLTAAFKMGLELGSQDPGVQQGPQKSKQRITGKCMVNVAGSD